MTIETNASSCVLGKIATQPAYAASPKTSGSGRVVAGYHIEAKRIAEC